MAEQDKKVRATIARGRTLVMSDPSQMNIVGYDSEGKAIKRAKSVAFGEHQDVELPAAEVTRLRKLGYLVDPGAAPIPTADGPSFTELPKSSDAAKSVAA
ncbi:hypothetical protein ACE10Z_23610 [Bradyrhizobium sp. Pha-3]|uniref:hypothetical protein n=1 Tax=Bradyrhizobium sp. Pha-3 TaxID=208375 RepID=UPI0035D50DA1